MTNSHQNPPTPPAESPRKLRRSEHDRMLTGVSGGLADYLGVDSALIRVVAVVAGVLTFGGALLAYVVAYLLMEKPDGSPAPLTRWTSPRSSPSHG